MTDIIGRLGSTNNSGTGTTTVYQVPAGKAARFKLFFRGKSGAGSGVQFSVNGIEIMEQSSLNSGSTVYSSLAALWNVAANDAAVTGVDDAHTAMPYQRDYFASAGDLVQMSISSANMQSMAMQVVGSEVDVT